MTHIPTKTLIFLNCQCLYSQVGLEERRETILSLSPALFGEKSWFSLDVKKNMQREHFRPFQLKKDKSE